jgi:transglutaminase-like putative cysteine protease
LIYLESRILNFYAQNHVLPKYAAVNSWKTSNDNTNYPQYLKTTANCQSNNQNIINLANSINTGKTSSYDKATAIFNWVNNHTTYAFYYNTVKGALGTLSSGSANCCDTTHLLIALTRAAGIPARYQHGICTFNDGEFGHVWAQVYVNGKWYYADAISPRNTFGTINNWDTSNWTLAGIYAELPF